MPIKNNVYINRRFRLEPLFVKVKILLLVLSISVAGCQSAGDAQPDVKVDWRIEPSPPQVGKTTLNLTLKDSTDHLITGADIKLEGNMSHPGMNPFFTSAKEVEPGQYSAEMNFTMAGDWFIIVTISLGDSTKVEKQIKVPGVRSQ